MTESFEATKKRLTELTGIVAELESSLHKRSAGLEYQRGRDASRKRPRSVTACNKCRALKIRCERDPTSQSPCARCAEFKIQCEIEKCKRGRVRGSKNKDKSMAFRPIGAPERVPDPPFVGTTEPEPSSGQRLASEDTFDPLSAHERLQLPLESARHSPEMEDRHLRDGPHPLSLLSNVALSMLAAADQPQQAGGDQAAASQESQEDVLPGWTFAQLQRASKQKQAYYRYGLNAIKRDVALKLDPITRGIVTEDGATALVAGFFRCLQPQVGIMDPMLHTVGYLRANSCLLLTAVLAASAHIDPTAEAHDLADTLYLHAERLFLIAISSDAKSPEIVLALLVLYLWPKFPEKNVDDRSRIFLTLAINMAVELGFPRLPRDIDGDLFRRRQHRDLIRTWTDLYIHDRSLSAFSGRPPLIKAHAGADEMRSWLQDKELVTLGDHMIIGYLELRAMENESRTRLAEITQPYLASAVKLSALAQLDAWTREWCGGQLIGTAFAHMMEFVAIHLALLIRSKGVAEADPSGNEGQMRHLAQKSLDYLLQNMNDNARYTCRTVCAMITWNAVILLKLSGDSARDTVRTVGLAMAPFGDGRMDQGAAFFYGSLLLELSFDKRLSAIDGPLNPLHGIMPSPSTLWVLQQSILPSSLTPALIPPVFETAESNAERAAEPVFGFDFPIWNEVQELVPSDEHVLPDIFSGAEHQTEWQGMSSDWSWLFDNSNPF